MILIALFWVIPLWADSDSKDHADLNYVVGDCPACNQTASLPMVENLRLGIRSTLPPDQRSPTVARFDCSFFDKAPKPKWSGAFGNTPATKLIPQLTGLNGMDRDAVVEKLVKAGNIPQGTFNFFPIESSERITNQDGTIDTVTAKISVMPNYLALGTDTDYVLVPVSGITADRLRSYFDLGQPTSRMVDLIWHAGKQIIIPGMTPDNTMTTTKVFQDYNQNILKWLETKKLSTVYGAVLLAGQKKDLVLGPRVVPGGLWFYGMASGHKDRGKGRMPYVQKESVQHPGWYADYSHGVRFVSQVVYIRRIHAGKTETCEARRLDEILTDKNDTSLCKLLSYVCPIPDVRSYVPKERKPKVQRAKDKIPAKPALVKPTKS